MKHRIKSSSDDTEIKTVVVMRHLPDCDEDLSPSLLVKMFKLSDLTDLRFPAWFLQTLSSTLCELRREESLNCVWHDTSLSVQTCTNTADQC